jgi:hypothetical protein
MTNNTRNLHKTHFLSIIITFMPQRRSPSEAEVLAAHLAICRVRFSAEASSPCCRVPIFKSSTHGRSNLDADATFSSIMKTKKKWKE